MTVLPNEIQLSDIQVVASWNTMEQSNDVIGGKRTYEFRV
nr:MAG: hypothetical protein BECKFW1821B_GA0114236_10191 [Candidatus Kentron sp. FW]